LVVSNLRVRRHEKYRSAVDLSAPWFRKVEFIVWTRSCQGELILHYLAARMSAIIAFDAFTNVLAPENSVEGYMDFRFWHIANLEWHLASITWSMFGFPRRCIPDILYLIPSAVHKISSNSRVDFIQRKFHLSAFTTALSEPTVVEYRPGKTRMGVPHPFARAKNPTEDHTFFAKSSGNSGNACKARRENQHSRLICKRTHQVSKFRPIDRRAISQSKAMLIAMTWKMKYAEVSLVCLFNRALQHLFIKHNPLLRTDALELKDCLCCESVGIFVVEVLRCQRLGNEYANIDQDGFTFTNASLTNP
jgi:hypothetical protein